jgi:dUTP pyrophosphatase
MFEKFKDFKNNIKTIKDLQSKMGDVDMSNPESMLKSMGIDIDDINNHFEQTQFIDRKVPLEFINNSNNQNPEYAYVSDSGFDLRSNEDVWIHPMSRNIIKTGLIFNIPDGYEIQVRSKSGIALKQGLFVLNSPGTVDSGYLGEIQVIMFNTTTEKVKIEKGQKIAQAVLCPVVGGKWVELIKVEKIEDKDRNNNGFGSTGL